MDIRNINFPRQLSVDVVCLSSKTGAVKSLTLEFIKNNGKPFPMPCTGCNDFNNSAACQKCVSKITKIFYDDPFTDTSKPLRLL